LRKYFILFSFFKYFYLDIYLFYTQFHALKKNIFFRVLTLRMAQSVKGHQGVKDQRRRSDEKNMISLFGTAL